MFTVIFCVSPFLVVLYLFMVHLRLFVDNLCHILCLVEVVFAVRCVSLGLSLQTTATLAQTSIDRYTHTSWFKVRNENYCWESDCSIKKNYLTFFLCFSSCLLFLYAHVISKSTQISFSRVLLDTHMLIMDTLHQTMQKLITAQHKWMFQKSPLMLQYVRNKCMWEKTTGSIILCVQPKNNTWITANDTCDTISKELKANDYN